MTNRCLEAVRDLFCRCCPFDICWRQGAQESRPIIPRDDREENIDNIRKGVITNQLKLSGVEIAGAETNLNVKEKIVRHILKQKEHRFTREETYSVFCGTWNVNGETPPDSLQMWFDQVGKEDERRKTPPDIIVIGLQEVGKTLSFGSEVAQEWNRVLMSSLPEHGNYSLIEMVRMLRIVMFVYVEDSIQASLSNIYISKVPTGLLGITGNKGGVGIRMNIHNTSLCFINSHLAANQRRCKRRNKDYRDVDRKMKFKTTSTICKIRDHDKIFWIGDLNYRIDDTIEEVKRKIKEKKYKDLLQNDQLRQQREGSAAFEGYHEKPIHFNPTYKYNKGSNEWDSKKNRIPAWCDRILYTGYKGDMEDIEDIEVDHYTSHPDMLFSDHMPVSSLFRIAVKQMDENKYDKIYKKVVARISAMNIPYEIDFNTLEVEFKDLSFLEPRKQTLTVNNRADIPVPFKFANANGNQRVCKPWLTIDPHESMISAKSRFQIQLEVLIDKTCVASLDAPNFELHDDLTVVFNNAHVVTIKVKGNLIPTSFGRSLEALVHMPGPIRNKLTGQKLEEGKLKEIPTEICRLMDHILEHGERNENLFREEGFDDDLEKIINCLDEGEPDEIPAQVASVAEALVLFLECLPDPVIPYSVYEKFQDPHLEPQQLKNEISKIPEHHRNLFKKICGFLGELLNNPEENTLDSTFLCSLFGKLLIRPSTNALTQLNSDQNGPENESEENENEKLAAFMSHFLEKGFS